MSKPLCTVLIPFDAPGRARFGMLEDIGKELGFETIRVAQYYSSGMILEEVVRSICDADLIIADLTGTNPNVCYELGIAHALGKRTFLTAEDPEECSIDVGPSKVCRFEASSAGRDRLVNALRSLLRTPGTLSPIDIFTGGLAVAGQRVMARRIGGFALDLLILAPLFAALFALETALAPEFAAAYPGGLVFPVALIYFLLTSVWLVTTPGQRIARLRVIRLDRTRPSLSQRVLRPITSLLNVMSLGIGFLWAARAPRHQAVHDLITRTLVVHRSSVEASRPIAPAPQTSLSIRSGH